MIAALDVGYSGEGDKEKALAACVLFQAWSSSEPSCVYTASIEKPHPYIPGEFYKRELPCLLRVLEKVDLTGLEAILVDSYVNLPDGHPGLGAYLYEALGCKIPVIGLALLQRFRRGD